MATIHWPTGLFRGKPPKFAVSSYVRKRIDEMSPSEAVAPTELRDDFRMYMEIKRRRKARAAA